MEKACLPLCRTMRIRLREPPGENSHCPSTENAWSQSSGDGFHRGFMSTAGVPASNDPRGSVLFQDYDSLEPIYFFDIFGLGVEKKRIPILHFLHGLGCSVDFAPFRETVSCKGVVMST